MSRSNAFLATCLAAIAAAVVLTFVLPTGRSGTRSTRPAVRVLGVKRIHRPLPTHRTPPPHGAPAEVAVRLKPAGSPVPADFLGLSFEVGELHWLARWVGHGTVAALLRSLGHGVLRFGGVSADERAQWLPAGAKPAKWESRPITEAQLSRLAKLAKQTGWKVLLSVNLGHFDPQAAAEEIAAARRLMGKRLLGVEIGNEPDRYYVEGHRAKGWSVPMYLHQVAQYRRAIDAKAPGVPLYGPDGSSGIPVLPWVKQAAAEHPSVLTTHFYPLSKCGYTPIVTDLTSPVTREKDAEMLTALTKIGDETGIPVLLDETNDISCRGQTGVSNSFASALWATDYIVHAMASKVAGLDFHTLLGEPGSYAPFAAHGTRALQAGELQVNPEWYALLMTRRLIGLTPISTIVLPSSATEDGMLTAAAFRGSGGAIRIVLDDFQPPEAGPLVVRLRVPGRWHGGPILRLLGPSPASITGTSLAGARVAKDGTWQPRTPLPAVYGRDHDLSVQMPPSSAALLTLEPGRR